MFGRVPGCGSDIGGVITWPVDHNLVAANCLALLVLPTKIPDAALHRLQVATCSRCCVRRQCSLLTFVLLICKKNSRYQRGCVIVYYLHCFYWGSLILPLIIYVKQAISCQRGTFSWLKYEFFIFFAEAEKIYVTINWKSCQAMGPTFSFLRLFLLYCFDFSDPVEERTCVYWCTLFPIVTRYHFLKNISIDL